MSPHPFSRHLFPAFWQLPVIAVALLLAPAQARADDFQGYSPRILESAGETDYPPYSLIGADGNADGFSVDLLRAAARAVGLKIHFAVGPRPEIQAQLADGRLDALPVVRYSKELEKIYDFSAPYLHRHGAVFVREGEKGIHGIADLKDKEVIVRRGGSAHDYVVKNGISDKPILTSSYEESMRLLAAGKHDAVVTQELGGLMLLKKLGISNVVDLNATGEKDREQGQPLLEGFDQKLCFAVREGNRELLAQLNEGLAIVYSNGTYDTLYTQWFAPLLPRPKVPFRELLLQILAVIVPLMLAMAGAGIWYLKREVAKKTASYERSQEKFRDFMNSATDGFLLYDPQFRLIEINDRALEILPLNAGRQQLLGANPLEAIPSFAGSERYLALRRVLETGDPCCLEEDFSHPVSGLRFASLTFFKVADDIGVILRDITERKLSVEALTRSEEKVRLLLEHTVEAIYGMDMDGNCTFANPACHRMLGYRRMQGQRGADSLIGRNMHRLTHHTYPNGKPYPEEACGIARAFRERQSSHCDSEVFWRADGASFPVEYWSHPVYQGGEVRGCVITFMDITKRRRAEEERRRLEIKLQQSFKMEAIGNLAGGIAHDFNNILGAILGYSEMAQEESDPRSTVHGNLGEVLKAGQRARELVRRILTFSRQSAESEFHYLQPAAVIREVEKMLRPTLPSTIAIDLTLPPTDRLLFADSTQIHQILMNLCTNAYHAMEEHGGRMKIMLAETELTADDVAHEPGVEAGRFFRLTVQDTGKGIPPEIQLKIFDPFFTTKEVGKGTGMGLSMVHGIVKNHGGCITVDSTPEQGASFHVFLPAVERGQVEEVTHREQLIAGTESILYVDDEKMLVAMGQSMLTRLGYAVTAVNSSQEAFEIFRQQPHRFDLVITDHTMPGMTGAEMARKILDIRPDIPIIVCTGYSSMLSEEKAKAIGIREFVLKPMLKKDLAPLIRKVLAENNQKAKWPGGSDDGYIGN